MLSAASPKLIFLRLGPFLHAVAISTPLFGGLPMYPLTLGIMRNIHIVEPLNPDLFWSPPLKMHVIWFSPLLYVRWLGLTWSPDLLPGSGAFWRRYGTYWSSSRSHCTASSREWPWVSHETYSHRGQLSSYIRTGCFIVPGHSNHTSKSVVSGPITKSF